MDALEQYGHGKPVGVHAQGLRGCEGQTCSAFPSRGARDRTGTRVTIHQHPVIDAYAEYFSLQSNIQGISSIACMNRKREHMLIVVYTEHSLAWMSGIRSIVSYRRRPRFPNPDYLPDSHYNIPHPQSEH